MKKDVILYEYLSDNGRYADLINGFSFGGRQVLSPEDLTERDSRVNPAACSASHMCQSRENQDGGSWIEGNQDTEDQGIGSRIGGNKDTKNQDSVKRNRKNNRSPRYRDLIRKAAFGTHFVVIGVENQSETDYLMPLRTMIYDTGEYENQAKCIRRKVQNREEENVSAAEFLSGFLKKSRLEPCVTIVLFFGDEWTGSTDLHGILDFTDIPEELRNMVQNYRINLLEIKKLEDTSMFHTDLRQVFDFIRFAEDKKRLRALVEQDESYAEMEEEAYNVVAAYTKSAELIHKKENYTDGGKVNMCRAITEMLQDERAEGREEGRKEGEEKGKARNLINNVESAMKNFNLNLQAVCEGLGTTKEEYYRAKEIMKSVS